MSILTNNTCKTSTVSNGKDIEDTICDISTISKNNNIVQGWDYISVEKAENDIVYNTSDIDHTI